MKNQKDIPDIINSQLLGKIAQHLRCSSKLAKSIKADLEKLKHLNEEDKRRDKILKESFDVCEKQLHTIKKRNKIILCR
jgi:hypothetical protein